MTWDSERDLLGWELDDVLEGYECDFVVEPGNVLLDPDVRDKLDQANPSRFDEIASCSSLGELWSTGLDIAARENGVEP